MCFAAPAAAPTYESTNAPVVTDTHHLFTEPDVSKLRHMRSLFRLKGRERESESSGDENMDMHENRREKKYTYNLSLLVIDSLSLALLLIKRSGDAVRVL